MSRRYVVWGTGPATVPAVMSGVGSQDALETAGENGFHWNESWTPDDWAVEVRTDLALEEQLTADPCIKGFIIKGVGEA